MGAVGEVIGVLVQGQQWRDARLRPLHAGSMYERQKDVGLSWEGCLREDIPIREVPLSAPNGPAIVRRMEGAVAGAAAVQPWDASLYMCQPRLVSKGECCSRWAATCCSSTCKREGASGSGFMPQLT